MNLLIINVNFFLIKHILMHRLLSRDFPIQYSILPFSFPITYINSLKVKRMRHTYFDLFSFCSQDFCGCRALFKEETQSVFLQTHVTYGSCCFTSLFPGVHKNQNLKQIVELPLHAQDLHIKFYYVIIDTMKYIQ